ncbi:uncharacterized protein LOC124931828 [Impatiens glandulifera]|uniref:uncharacterized protein LOC124931828 n=1 Tax=Impatiens glandulifera TaxID=253017 RepID=UPI001FB1A1E5|nr:uncharacterized protein LOC124931828 [Impatiens glandulifera]
MAINSYHIRSISFPSRLHKTSTRIDEELTRFKTHEEEPICHGLSGLIELYKCLNDLLNSPTATQAVLKADNMGRIGFLLDGSMKILDICGITRDLVAQMKENVIDLQSSLRRRKGDSSNIETSIAKYISLRKSIAKKAKKLAFTLKQDQKDDQETEHVVKILSQVTSANFRVFESLLGFLGKTKSRSMVPKWLQKGCEKNLSSNELERVDEALYGVCKGEKIVAAMDSLKCLESGIEEMENGLEGLFRQLIRARSSLLNIVSQ